VQRASTVPRNLGLGRRLGRPSQVGLSVGVLPRAAWQRPEPTLPALAPIYNEEPQRVIIVSDTYEMAPAPAAAAATGASASIVRGHRIENVVPSRSLERTVHSPPCACAICCTM
jgi:hypothetical protein